MSRFDKSGRPYGFDEPGPPSWEQYSDEGLIPPRELLRRQSTPPSSIRDPHWIDEESSRLSLESTLPPPPPDPVEHFTFPPPVVPSVAPVAFVPDDDGGGYSKSRTRVRPAVMLAATGMIAIGAAVVLLGFGAITSRSNPAWGWGWRSPSALAGAAAAESPAVDPPQSTGVMLAPVTVFGLVPNASELEAPATPLMQPPATPSLPGGVPAAANSTSPDTVSVGGRSKQAATDLSQRAVRAAAGASIESALRTASATCRQQDMSPVSAVVSAEFNPDGRVVDVEVAIPADAQKIAGCLAVAAKQCRIDPFEGDPVTVTRATIVR